MRNDSRDLVPVVRRPLMLVPSDDEAFSRAAAFAVELYDITEPDPLDPPGRRQVDDSALVAAAQAMLRGAYPRATIVALPKAPSGRGATWLVSRDPGRSTRPGVGDVVRSEPRSAGGSTPDALADDRASDDGMPDVPMADGLPGPSLPPQEQPEPTGDLEDGHHDLGGEA